MTRLSKAESSSSSMSFKAEVHNNELQRKYPRAAIEACHGFEDLKIDFMVGAQQIGLASLCNSTDVNGASQRWYYDSSKVNFHLIKLSSNKPSCLLAHC